MPTPQDLEDFASLIARLPPTHRAAVERARAAYNAGNPESALSSAEAYWWFVFARANESYRVQYPEAQ